MPLSHHEPYGFESDESDSGLSPLLDLDPEPGASSMASSPVLRALDGGHPPVAASLSAWSSGETLASSPGDDARTLNSATRSVPELGSGNLTSGRSRPVFVPHMAAASSFAVASSLPDDRLVPLMCIPSLSSSLSSQAVSMEAGLLAQAQRASRGARLQPSRMLIISGLRRNAPRSPLMSMLEEAGQLRALDSASDDGTMMVASFYDLRHALAAQERLDGSVFDGRTIAVRFAPPGAPERELVAADVDQDSLIIVFNVLPSVSLTHMVSLFSPYGDIRRVSHVAAKRHKVFRFVEFYDARAAAAAVADPPHPDASGVGELPMLVERARSKPGTHGVQWEVGTPSNSPMSSPMAHSPPRSRSRSTSCSVLPPDAAVNVVKHVSSPSRPPRAVPEPGSDYLAPISGLMNAPLSSSKRSNSLPSANQDSDASCSPPLNRPSLLSASLAESKPTGHSLWSSASASRSRSRTRTRSKTRSKTRSSSRTHSRSSRSSRSSSRDSSTSRKPRRRQPDPACVISVDALEVGDETRTTAMIRNIPNRYRRDDLLAALTDAHLSGQFDFVYLPVDAHHKANVGYAFVNFVSPAALAQAYRALHGASWRRYNSDKVCRLAFAHVQGQANLISHFRAKGKYFSDPDASPLAICRDTAPDGARAALGSRGTRAAGASRVPPPPARSLRVFQ